VAVDANGTPIAGSPLTAPPDSDDAVDPGVLNVGEIWSWTVSAVPVSVDTTFTATGHGTDSLGNDVTYPQYPSEQASAMVKTVGAIRTPGFWKTHLNFTTYVFDNYLGSINIGWKDITNMDDLMGVFWASPAKNADGSKRSKLCQAKEQAAFQAVAAILNSALSNSAPLPVPLATIQSTLSGTDRNAIRALQATLDTYNNSGETIALTGVPTTGHADPQAAKTIANIPFADCP